MTITASIVVPTFKRPDLLSRCLATLVTQQFDPAAYEVIVADDAANEDTRSLVETWAKRAVPQVRYIPVSGAHGPASARNCGWRVARGRIIAFTDDDCIPVPTWLQAGVDAFVDGVAGAWGRLAVPVPPVPTDFQRDAARLCDAEFVTANCFYRRDVLESVDGFDERFGMAWREDSDLHFTLMECCDRLVRADNATVVHPLRTAEWGISLKQQRKSMFNALLYKKHPLLYRQRVQASPPLRYYGAVASLLTVLGGVAVGQSGVILGASLLWTVLTAQFCVKRLRGTSHSPTHLLEMLVTSILIPPVAVFWRVGGAVKFRVFFL